MIRDCMPAAIDEWIDESRNHGVKREPLSKEQIEDAIPERIVNQLLHVVANDASPDDARTHDLASALARRPCVDSSLDSGHDVAGEDLPESESDTISTPSKTPAKPVIAKAPKANAEGGEPAKPQLKKDTEEWTKVVKWIGDNKDKTIEDIEKILKSRFTIAPAALKELGLILGTNG